MIILVLLCQSLVYKEVTALFDLRDREWCRGGPRLIEQRAARRLRMVIDGARH